MSKFIIRDRVPCWVTWTYEIEADDEKTAINRYLDGDYDSEGHGEPEIGDTIDAIDGELSTEEVKDN